MSTNRSKGSIIKRKLPTEKIGKNVPALKDKINLSSYVIVRIWPSKVNSKQVGAIKAFMNDGNVGHLSLEIVHNGERVYASHWPGEDMNNPTSVVKRYANRKLADDIFSEYAIDEKTIDRENIQGLYQGAIPDFSFKLFSLDTAAILEKYKEIKDKPYSLVPKAGESFNCISLVHTLLLSGGFARLNPADSNLRTTPTRMREIMEKAVRNESRLYQDEYDISNKALIDNFLAELRSSDNQYELEKFFAKYPDYNGLHSKNLNYHFKNEYILAIEKLLTANLKKFNTDKLRTRLKAHNLSGEGLAAQVKEVLKKSVQVDARDIEGLSPMYWAIHHNENNVRELMQAQMAFAAESPTSSDGFDIALSDIAAAKLPEIQIVIQDNEIKFGFANEQMAYSHILKTLHHILSHRFTENIKSTYDAENQTLTINADPTLIRSYLQEKGINLTEVTALSIAPSVAMIDEIEEDDFELETLFQEPPEENAMLAQPSITSDEYLKTLNKVLDPTQAIEAHDVNKLSTHWKVFSASALHPNIQAEIGKLLNVSAISFVPTEQALIAKLSEIIHEKQDKTLTAYFDLLVSTESVEILTPKLQAREKEYLALQARAKMLGLAQANSLPHQTQLHDMYPDILENMELLKQKLLCDKFFTKLTQTAFHSLKKENMRLHKKYGEESKPQAVVLDLLCNEQIPNKLKELKASYQHELWQTYLNYKNNPMFLRHMGLATDKLKTRAKEDLAALILENLVKNPDVCPNRSKLSKFGRGLANVILVIPNSVYWLATGNTIFHVFSNKTQKAGKKAVKKILKLR